MWQAALGSLGPHLPTEVGVLRRGQERAVTTALTCEQITSHPPDPRAHRHMADFFFFF